MQYHRLPPVKLGKMPGYQDIIKRGERKRMIRFGEEGTSKKTGSSARLLRASPQWGRS